MNKKLMLLATGALAALAFAALPAVASAGEYTADCEGGGVCEGTVTGGATQIRNDKGESISCSSIDGTATVISGSSTGVLALTLTGCVETITGFKFKCNSSGAATGEVKTGSLTTHLVYLEHNATTPGIKVTAYEPGITFTCAGFSRKTVTGSLVGHISNPNCGTFQQSHTAVFEESSTGVQRWNQVTTTGEKTDLISNNDAGGAYTTMAVTGSTTINWAAGHQVKLTC